MSNSLMIFGAPGRYLQGAGALASMGEHLARIGASAVLVADRAVLDLFGERIDAACGSAGIGDAIVKRFEVAQCMAAPDSRNIFHGRPLRAAGALADLCYTTLREFAEPALVAVRERRVTEDVERVVEATVFHSGLGFESGGLSLSRGLSAVRGARDALHGFQVAYALLVQITLEGRSAAFIDDIRQFYRRVGLPLCLADLGMPLATPDEARAIAEGTMTAPHARHFERIVSADDIAGAMRRVEGLAPL